MLGSFMTSILYFLGLLDPHLRYAFQPIHILAAWTESEGQLSVKWSTGLPVHFSELRFREAQCDSRPARTNWQSLTPDSELFFKYKLIFWEILYTAILSGLEDNCWYEYQVGGGMYKSEVFKISGRTPYYHYNESKAKAPASVIIFGDMGTGIYSQPTRDFLKKYLDDHHEVAALLHLGDVAYNLDYQGGIVGDDFLSDMAGITERVPYMLAPGNHEGAHNFTHFRKRFRMPVTPENEGSNFFYSFNLGAAHFVMYSTEVYEFNSNETQLTQRNWLQEDLRRANQLRTATPWVFVLGHKPQYCNVDWTRSLESVYRFRSNDNCATESPGLRKELEDIFYNNSVDAVISGHVHKYERESAIYKNLTVLSEKDEEHLHFNARAPIHIISGIAGSDHEKNPISLTPQLWNRFESNEYGFGVLTVVNTTHIYWQQYDAESRQVVDYLWVIKTHPRY